jgi:hypothetical protein
LYVPFKKKLLLLVGGKGNLKQRGKILPIHYTDLRQQTTSSGEEIHANKYALVVVVGMVNNARDGLD